MMFLAGFVLGIISIFVFFGIYYFVATFIQRYK